jgi:hypothetical protein
MAAANESQGLKIAVAAFITLTVILTVTSYFLYSNGASAEARLQSEMEAHSKTKSEKNLALNQYNEVRSKVGTKNEDPEPAKEEIAANFKKIEERLNNLTAQVTAAVQDAQSQGAQGPELQDAKENVLKAIASFRSEPNKSYISSLDRLTELMENMAKLTTQLSINYVAVRRNLEGATSVAKSQVDTQAKAAADSQAEVLNEQKKHADERSTLITKVDQLQTDNDKTHGEVLSMTQKNKQQEDEFSRQRETLLTIQREQRDRLEQKEIQLDRPDGYVTYVDYQTREVLVSLTRRMGARPQMKMTIFDARSPGIPTEKPKGSIELTSVGEQFSTARILKSEWDSRVDPIRVGDIVYSAAWSPNQPVRFALVGKMDVNRDNKDDREELKRMIVEAGGVVDYDLPPPEIGKETGTLTPRIDWYVIDLRMPLRGTFERKSDANAAATAKFQTRIGEVQRDARLNGIRPMTIERLLAYLGYDMNSPIIGRAEAVDEKSLMRLVAPRRPAETLAKPAGETTKAESKAETKTEEAKSEAAEMKEEQPKDETKTEAKPKARAKTKAKSRLKARAKKTEEDEESGDTPK